LKISVKLLTRWLTDRKKITRALMVPFFPLHFVAKYRWIVALCIILFGVLSGYAQSNDELGSADSTLLDEVNINEEQQEFVGPSDSISVKNENFDEATLDRLKTDPDYQYKQPPTVAESLWDRIKRWIADLIRALFQGATGTDIGRFIMYMLGIILLSLIVMMLLKVDALRVFYSGADKGKKVNAIFHENIHEMDFETLLHDAIQKEDFRQSTRLILLYALKLLSDKNHIDWKVGKTNHDYVNELSVGSLKTGLNELSFYFDYTWYGNFEMTRETFGKVQNTFTDWRGKIN
jgi:hypothetical protein